MHMTKMFLKNVQIVLIEFYNKNDPYNLVFSENLMNKEHKKTI